MAIMEIDQPLVSVIMNCHNCSDFLQEAIKSVYSQTYKNWEIIFFDNASNDESSKIAHSYNKKLKYFYIDKKIPLGSARNNALTKAKGDYIAFLDCDDEFLPNKLHDQVLIMQQYDSDMCYGSAYHIDHNSQIIRKKRVPNKKGKLFSSLLISYNINMQTVMIKRNMLDRCNLNFDQSLLFSPDYDLFMEIALIGNTVSLKKYLSNYRLHAQSLSKKSQHLVCKEGLYTLDRLKKKYKDTFQKYSFTFKYARSVFKIQEAVACLQDNNSLQAKRVLMEELPVNYKTLILLLLLYLKVSPQLILIIIGRGK